MHWISKIAEDYKDLQSCVIFCHLGKMLNEGGPQVRAQNIMELRQHMSRHVDVVKFETSDPVDECMVDEATGLPKKDKTFGESFAIAEYGKIHGSF